MFAFKLRKLTLCLLIVFTRQIEERKKKCEHSIPKLKRRINSHPMLWNMSVMFGNGSCLHLFLYSLHFASIHFNSVLFVTPKNTVRPKGCFECLYINRLSDIYLSPFFDPVSTWKKDKRTRATKIKSMNEEILIEFIYDILYISFASAYIDQCCLPVFNVCPMVWNI